MYNAPPYAAPTESPGAPLQTWCRTAATEFSADEAQEEALEEPAWTSDG